MILKGGKKSVARLFQNQNTVKRASQVPMDFERG